MMSKRIHCYYNHKPSLWVVTCEQTVVKEVIFMSEVISQHELNDIFSTIVLPLESSTKSYSEGSNHSAISTFGANPSQDSDLLMAESSMRTKRFTRWSEAKRDRISALPDEILSCILSFLPTKYAVGTSILSKRWKFLWTFTPNLVFDDSLLFSAVLPEEETPFLNFVERVVRCHNDLSRVRKFELRCFGAYSVSRICKLIYAAASIMPNVEEIHLDFCTGQLLFGFGTEMLVELPQNIYASCERLQVLKLSGDIVMNVPPLVRFSSLKTLRLTLVHYKKDDSLEKLLAGCPILEDLYIQPSLTFSETVNVCSSSLRNLEIQNDIPPLRAVAQRGRFVLETPNLEQLKLRDHSEGVYNVKDVSSLVSANVDFKRPHKKTSLLQLLKKISHVGELRLSDHTVDILQENRNDEIPFFHNLTHLKVGISKVGKSIVPRLLQRSPNLASFKVEKVSAQPGEGSK